MSARVPRITSQQPAQCQTATPYEAVSHDRLLRIFRARRMESAARSEQRAHRVPVDREECDDGASNHHARENSLSRSWRASDMVACAGSALTEIRKSPAGNCARRSRNVSRTRRRIRLRATAAFTIFFPTRTAKRGYPTALSPRRTMNHRPRSACAPALTAWIDSSSLSRAARGNRQLWVTPRGGPDLSPAARAAPTAPRAS